MVRTSKVSSGAANLHKGNTTRSSPPATGMDTALQSIAWGSNGDHNPSVCTIIGIRVTRELCVSRDSYMMRCSEQSPKFFAQCRKLGTSTSQLFRVQTKREKALTCQSNRLSRQLGPRRVTEELTPEPRRVLHLDHSAQIHSYCLFEWKHWRTRLSMSRLCCFCEMRPILPNSF